MFCSPGGLDFTKEGLDGFQVQNVIESPKPFTLSLSLCYISSMKLYFVTVSSNVLARWGDFSSFHRDSFATNDYTCRFLVWFEFRRYYASLTNPGLLLYRESYLISACLFSGQCVTGPDVATLTATNEVGWFKVYLVDSFCNARNVTRLSRSQKEACHTEAV